MKAFRVPLLVVGSIVGAFGLGYLVTAKLWDRFLEAGRG